MSYEYQKYKKDRASIIPIEETYTNDDVNTNDTNIAENGYRFNTPRRWMTDKSTSKSIGVRDLHLKAPNANFNCKFLFYLKVGMPVYPVTWNTDHYDIDRDHPDTTTNVIEDNIYISDWVEVRATPSNNFEEVFYNIINNKLNSDDVWKEVELTFMDDYVLRSPSEAHERGDLWVESNNEEDEDDESDVTKASMYNLHPGPIPTNIYYDYDGNKAELGLYIQGIFQILVKSNREERFRTIDVNINKDTDTCKHITTVKGYNTEQEGITHCYNYPRLYQASLLMLLDRDNNSEIENCYSFFNQPLPTDADGNYVNMVCITVDDVEYLVPFVNEDSNDGTNMTLTKNNRPFNCHFALYSDADNDIISTKINNEADAADGDVDLHTNLDLNNVWDRTNLYYHASFADNRHKIIGRNGDHWDTPNKRFAVATGAEDNFNIWFTTDGHHRILPVGCIFNIDLTFMLNGIKNTATGL